MDGDVESWLKNTVPGIVVLGAMGSFAAVIVLQLLASLTNAILPLPFKIFRKQRSKQAFMLGYAASIIDKDKSGKWLTAYLA